MVYCVRVSILVASEKASAGLHVDWQSERKFRKAAVNAKRIIHRANEVLDEAARRHAEMVE